MPARSHRIQVSATYTAEPLSRVLDFWAEKLGLELRVAFSPFGQVFQQALDSNSESSANGRDDLNLFLLRLEDLGEESRSADATGAELVGAIGELASRSAAPTWVIFCPHPDRDEEAAAVESRIVERLEAIDRVEAWGSAQWRECYPVASPFDSDAYEAGRIPFTDSLFAALGTFVVRRFSARCRPPAKVLVLDADHTLWGGVCGEERPEDLDLGGPWKKVREFARARREEGVLLCLASKNRAEDVDRVFAARGKDLGLSRDEFSGWRVNWNPKSESLRALAEELNLGLDSFAFLDDNPVEIAEVQAACPGVTTLQLPDEADAASRFLDHLWVLDSRGEATAEDRQRADFYRSEEKRRQLGQVSSSFEAFLDSLELEVDCEETIREDRARVAQLTRRTNQFNSTARRFSEEALGERLDSAKAGCLSVRVRDRFGDYGLVGAAVYRPELDEEDCLGVDAILLSCRAMGKGVERRMIDALAHRAELRGARSLGFAFSETDRNEPCRRFLEATGAEWDEDKSRFRLELEAARKLPRFLVAAARDSGPRKKASPEAEHSAALPLMGGDLAGRIALEWSDPERLREILVEARRDRPDLASAFVKPGTPTEKRIAEIWCEVLGLRQVGIEDSFVDLGGSSVQLVRVHAAIRKEWNDALELAEFFELPTISAIAGRLERSPEDCLGTSAGEADPTSHADDAVAIVGLALRVPGANNPETFWENLAAGVESISRFDREELAYPDEFDQPGFVPAKGLIDEIEAFDAGFFGILPKEAQIMDPQQRIFLELAWEAMERAGYRPDSHRERIGVYAGAYFDTYLLANLCSDPEFLTDLIPQIQVGSLQTELGNDKDYLATRVAFKLNLRGPAMTLQTACSTSMVAIVEACRAIRDGLCDMALAGGVTVTLPLKRGYFYTEQGMLSKDGRCRAFDAEASGTVFGNGAGVVMLKRLTDAIRDRDHIHAVIRGTGLNNDGGVKHSYTAPSVDGQVEVIRMAQADAGIEPASISYIEAHGTGTPLGDPIEVTALTRAFREGGVTGNGGCALGSLKTNIGHLDVASGVCGVIKTALSLEQAQLPPTLHYQSPNPQIDFDSSPFYVNERLRPWESVDGETPRRAGISSFGVGGTNAHVVLEEGPEISTTPSPRPDQLFLVSAKSETALEAARKNLSEFTIGGKVEAEDVAWTLAKGRQPFRHRSAVVAANLSELGRSIESGGGVTGLADRQDPPVTFLFPGQGAQHVGMARDFYESEPRFRQLVDRCSALLESRLELKLTDALFPDLDDGAAVEAATKALNHTILAQPAIFVIEYAMADLWQHWGVKPGAMIGHSVGEFVAACHAGVFSLEEGLVLLAERGRLMGELEGGGMLSVRLPVDALKKRLPADLDLAAVNGPSLCVVAGPRDRLQDLVAELEVDDVVAKPLHTSHAFHSRMMDPVIDRFARCFESVSLRAPYSPILSSVTGEWLTEPVATDPAYWSRHLRETVRFHEAVVNLVQKQGEGQLFLEVGPGQTLAGLVRQSLDRKDGHFAFSTCRHVKESGSDHRHALESLGRLWIAGVEVDWDSFYGGEKRKRVILPTYPFERKRHWVDADLRSRGREGSSLSPSPEASLPPASPIADHPPIPAAPAETVPVVSRLEVLSGSVREVLSDLSGIAVDDMDGGASFLELGFDSLLLTQVGKAFQEAFGTEFTMRQLMAEFATIEAVVAHLDSVLPEDQFRTDPVVPESGEPPVPTPAPPPVETVEARTPVGPMPTSGSAPTRGHADRERVEDIVSQQLEIMRQQIALLQGGTDPAPQPVPAAGSKSVKPEGMAKPAETSGKDTSAPATTIQREMGARLTPRQQSHLDDLIDRYTRKTPTSKALTARYRQWHADPRTASGFDRRWKEMVYQIAVERSQGVRLLDVDGNEYIDLLNGFGPNFLGHGNELVNEALHAQLDRGFALGPQSVDAMETARLFCELTGNERASFVNTGSEAVQAAMRLARTVTGRDKIVVFARDYHGNFDEVLVRGAGAGENRRSLPIAPGIPRGAVEEVIVLPYGSEESLEIIRDRGHELAAVVVEPVQSRRPEFQPREFIHALREITRDSGSLFVFDEVITGLRTGPGGAQDFYGVEADIATYGKVVGGGLPIGVVAGKAEFMDTFDGGAWGYGDDSFPERGVTFFAGTFVRHPLAMVATRRVLEFLGSREPIFWQEIRERADRLAGTIDRLFVDQEVPIRLPNFGSQMFFRVAEDQKTANLLFYHLRLRGVFMLEGFPSYLTAAHTDDDVDYVIDACRESIAEMQEGEFFSGPSEGSRLSTGETRLEAPPPKLDRKGLSVPGLGDSTSDPDRVYPMTAPLEEIWLASQVSEGASLCFNELNRITLSGPLNVPALEGALQDLVDRHDGLRSAFLADGSGFRIRPSQRMELPVTDLSGADRATRQQGREACLGGERSYLYDLEVEPLFRAHLLKFADEKHELLMGAHHIACDGWSFNLLNDELSRLYSARLRNEIGPGLARPSMSFGRYAQRRRDEERAGEGGADEHYWLERYAEPVPPLNLPVDRPRPEERDFRSDTTAVMLDRSQLDRLRKAAAGSGVTLFALLIGGYFSLLHRIGRQTRIAIAFPSAGQNREGLEDVVGHAVNFVPLVTDLDPSQAFGAFLGKLQGDLLDAFEHQDFTYGQLLKKLATVRTNGGKPFVEAAFNLERLDGYEEFEGLSSSCEEAMRTHVTDPLFLKATEGEEGLELRFDFHRSLYDRKTVALWLESYVAILERAVTEPEIPVIEIASSISEEQESRLRAWNDTSSDYPRKASVPALFREMVTKHGAEVALRSPEKAVTYSQLGDDMARIAEAVREAGGKSGEMIGLFLDRSPEMIAALLGILESGAAFVPLDPEYPQDRLEEMLEDSGARLVVTRAGLADRLPPALSRLAVEEIVDSSTPVPRIIDPGIGADAPAYLMYTSGSTGRPKGSLIPHRGIVRLVRDTDYCAFGPGEVTLQVATVCFDASTYEIFGALLNGGTLVIPPAGPLSLETIGHYLREEGITQLFLTSGLFQVLVDEDPGALEKVRQVLTGGDKASVEHVARVLEAFPRNALINGYGPTENTTFSACHRMSSADLERPSIPIGKPIANSTAWILDEDGRLLAPGIPGELCTGGDGVALGYHHRPELSAECFREDPFRSGESRARLYRTGDLARYLADGNIEFLGRIDHQVKIRGFRVEPGEIEVHLATHPGVARVKVVVRGEGAAEKALVAYVTPAREDVTPEALLSYLRGRLPDYLVPSAIVVLEELPLNANGKVDTRALPDPSPERAAVAAPIAASPTRAEAEVMNETETTLSKLWGEVLKVSDPKLDNDFFAVGGHSLLGMKLFARIQRHFRVNLPLATLFQAPTLRQLAAVIDARRDSGELNAPEPGREPEASGSLERKELDTLRVPEPGARKSASEDGSAQVKPSRVIHHAQGVETEIGPGNGTVRLENPIHRATVEGVANTTIAVQPKGSLPPVFGVHGGDGGVLFYRDLARGLGEGRPFYAFESPALTAGGALPDEPIEATATRYLSELRKVQPRGPYHLCGYSFGGVVAYEMACQLVGAGEEVAFLGLVDTHNPASPIRKLTLGERIAWNWKVPHGPATGFFVRLARLCLRVGGGVVYRICFEFETRAAQILPPARTAGWLRQVQLRMAHEEAMDAYVPSVFPGRLTLFRVKVSSDKFDLGADYGWKDRVDKLRILEIPGAHVTVFEPEHTPHIVAAFQRALPGPSGGEVVEKAKGS